MACRDVRGGFIHARALDHGACAVHRILRGAYHMTDCWGCRKSAETGLPGFVQADCVECVARDIASSPAGKGYEADPGALKAAMHKAWPLDTDFKRGRLAVWALLKPKKGGDENAT